MLPDRRGQTLVIVALSMVAMAGFLAMAVDAGRLFLSRRALQTAADGGALAGAQDLVGTVTSPSGSPPNSLYHGDQLALAPFGLTPTWPQGSSFYVNPPNNTITDTVGAYTVTVTSPSGYNNKRVSVTISQAISTTFASILGFGNVTVQASAIAEAGTNPFSYALFAYTSGGSGNTIWDDQNGYGQLDDGQDGADACSSSASGLTWSNAKFHVPVGGSGNYLNVNGNITVNQASDNHGLTQFWTAGMPHGTGIDAKPTYLAPNTSSLPLAPPRTVVYPGNSYKNVQNKSNVKWYVYSPGTYTTTVTIPAAGDDLGAAYIFLNGIYYFQGAALTITGGTVGNTSDGTPKYSGSIGITDLGPNTDGTNGVEFIIDVGSTFSATNSSTPNGGSVFFVGPTYVPTGSTGIAFFIPSTNTSSGAVWSETFSASGSNNPRFQIWGTVYDAADSSNMVLTGVQLGPHNTSPSGNDSSGQYAINGEFIGPTLNLYNGNVLGNSPGAPPTTCSPPSPINPGKPSLLVQYNSKFAPAPGVNSSLVQ